MEVGKALKLFAGLELGNARGVVEIINGNASHVSDTLLAAGRSESDGPCLRRGDDESDLAVEFEAGLLVGQDFADVLEVVRCAG